VKRSKARRPSLFAGESGFTLIEVMIAAFLLLVAFAGLSQVYTLGRGQLDLEEERRNASAVLQARLETIRNGVVYENLEDLEGSIESFTVDGKEYQVSHSVLAGDLETSATTLTLTVQWDALVHGNQVARTLNCTSIIGRKIE
jgi:prepilin-type N-terminal cleavage/methylation domain-containing protein